MALAQARKVRPDVMILDIRMPAGNGFSVLERIKKIPELRGLPVIYVTGDKSAEVDLRAEQLGACGLIHKPISLPLLIKAIDTAVEMGTQKTAPLSQDATRWMIPDPVENRPYEIGS
jgi:CheY-like chemotaxis protein